jgi:hypothetical protein
MRFLDFGYAATLMLGMFALVLGLSALVLLSQALRRRLAEAAELATQVTP